MNIFGEPNFRVVWGMDRLTIIGGEWVIQDEHGNDTGHVIEERRVHKYLPAERFYLEKWMPPEHYGSPEAWAEEQIEHVDGHHIPSLGPYPSRGEYEMAMCLKKNDQFVPLAGAEEALVDIVRMIKKGEAYTKNDNWLAIRRQQERETKIWDCRADAILDDENDFEDKPHIYMPGSPTPPKKRRVHTLTPKELKAIRWTDMGAKVVRAPQLEAR